MNVHTIKNQLLAGTSALALVAAVSAVPSQAFAAWGTISTATAVAQAATGSTTLTVGNGSNAGDLAVPGAIAATNTDQTDTAVVVNAADATHGIATTSGNFSAISVTGTGTLAVGASGGIKNTQGLISGTGTTASTATIFVNGATSTFTINNVGTSSFIKNTGAAGVAIDIGTNAAQVVTLTNGGSIISTGSTTSDAIRVESKTGSSLALTNTGTITAGSSGNAIFIGNNSSAAITQTSGSITGAINLGTAAQAASTLALNGGTVTGAVTVGDLSTVTLGGATYSGSIDGAAAYKGLVVVATGTTNAMTGAFGSTNGIASVNFNGSSVTTMGENAAYKLNATAINLNNTSTLNLGNTARTNSGDITMANTATLNIGTQTQTLNASTGSGNFTAGAGGNTIKIGVRDGTANHNGNILATGAASINAATNLYVDSTAATAYIATGKTYVWLTAASGNTTALVAGHVTDSSPLVSWAETVNGTTTRTLTATRVAGGYAGVATTNNTASAGSVLEALGAAGTNGVVGNTEIDAALGSLESSTSAAQVTDKLKELTPQVNATGSEAIASTGQSLNVVSTRLEQLRAGNDISIGNDSGMAAGGNVADKGLWFQGFGSTGTQDLRDGVDGYDVKTGGGAVGADMAVGNNSRLGASVSYARSTIDSNGSANQSTDIDSYQGNVYGSYNMGKWYTDGLLGFAYQDYNSERFITTPSVTASGDFSGETYTARATTGYHMAAGRGFDFTPNVGLTYYYNHVGSYTESGAGGLDLNVGSSNTQALLGRIGADLGYDIQRSTMLIRPVIRAGYSYDFIGDNTATTSSFTGAGATFNTKNASPERNSWDVGASLNLVTASNMTLSADYDYMAKSDYDSHTGVLRARFNF